jgi:hypothetical protein
MQDLMIRAYVLAGSIADSLRERAADPFKNEDGQATAEYVAVIVLMVAVIGAMLASGVFTDIAGAIGDAIMNVINQVKDAAA